MPESQGNGNETELRNARIPEQSPAIYVNGAESTAVGRLGCRILLGEEHVAAVSVGEQGLAPGNRGRSKAKPSCLQERSGRQRALKPSSAACKFVDWLRDNNTLTLRLPEALRLETTNKMSKPSDHY